MYPENCFKIVFFVNLSYASKKNELCMFLETFQVKPCEAGNVFILLKNSISMGGNSVREDGDISSRPS